MRIFWAVTGGLSLTLGIIGIILPLLPTVPFILLAAYCFARSFNPFHNWLLAHRHFGPMILDWRTSGAIRKRGKIAATVSIVAVFTFSLVLSLPLKLLLIQAVTLGGVLLFIWKRPEV